MIGKYDLFGDRMADALDARPTDESVWTSLRRVFDITLDHVRDDHQRARNDAMDRIVQTTPQLTARYLEKMQRLQALLIGRVAARLGLADAPDDPRPAAIVGAAFACMQAARLAWLDSNQTEPYEAYLDRAMGALRITVVLQRPAEPKIAHRDRSVADEGGPDAVDPPSDRDPVDASCNERHGDPEGGGGLGRYKSGERDGHRGGEGTEPGMHEFHGRTVSVTPDISMESGAPAGLRRW
ncbi:hypothetical protein DEI93_15980 [Curtobacterium sp. MCBD17_035]|uniref:acyl-CoA-like ligand-binding transcription factor n=1 Tax=Curtobacterium sp. MCBD17_035 TaxID=2175673 RepID=UPI000DA92AAE|nr:hypothetical protein [Curtobacterium sp. MCBD17_035]WIB67428.1 hypothetical protein DEI93_15980 [Curtobacterium sp. MCBD17_035]